MCVGVCVCVRMCGVCGSCLTRSDATDSYMKSALSEGHHSALARGALTKASEWADNTRGPADTRGDTCVCVFVCISCDFRLFLGVLKHT